MVTKCQQIETVISHSHDEIFFPSNGKGWETNNSDKEKIFKKKKQGFQLKEG